MFKKIVMSCAAAVVLGACFSSAVFAADVDAVAPVHWGSHPYNNLNGVFKTGKMFCNAKYKGRKTCIPAMNDTQDTLTINTSSYNNDSAPAGNVVALMGKDSVPTTIFTVMDVAADGKSTTVYSGPANDKEGIICSQDKVSKNTVCKAWN